MIFDTIVAISTKLGESALQVIRVSGEDSIDLVNRVFKGPNLNRQQPRTIHYGYIMDGDKTIDEVLISIFHAPKSFTAENMVEISCHGGQFIANEIIKLLIRNGARLAERGEFTQRAYLLGRIDLTKAEGIMDLINAKNALQLEIAHMQLRGDVLTLVNQFQDELLDIIAQIEVNIDYPEYDDVIEMTQEIIEPKIQTLLSKIKQIITKSNTGKIVRDGLQTVIIGKPNVGKSSLLNALIHEDKAIVTDISGTTRDLVEAELNLNGIILKLVDTAGIRNTEDVVEKIGIEKTKKAIEKADLVLLVIDQSQVINDSDRELIELTKNKPRIIIGNKSDLTPSASLDELKMISISAKNKTGLEELEKEVKSRFIDESIFENNEVVLSNTRHISKLEEARDRLEDALTSCHQMMPVDMIEIDLKSAWHLLNEIIGEESGDSLITTLFSKFCLGK